MPEPLGAGNRRIVGMALLASAVMLGVVAILCALGVFGLVEESRMVMAMAFGAAAVFDGLIALRFLLTSSS